MSNTIEQYREAKTSYLKLKNQAKKELIARFNELAGELLQVQRELLEDFGEKVAMPAKPKKLRAARKATEEPASPPKAAGKEKETAALEKRLERAKQKLAEAKAAGKPTKALDDKVYEIEDELRLLAGK
ncbi:MAG: hypothetical protein ABSF98_06225 [Bryobacteraceae bacterium]|jgi:hypothetical protein